MGNGQPTVIEHRRLAEMFPARPNDPVMPNWRRLMLELDLRFGPLQALKTDWQAAVHEMQQIALVRLNEILGPAYDTLTGFATLGPGWLLARSSSLANLQPGQTLTFILREGSERSLFVTTAYVIVQHADNFQNFALGKVLNYLPASGALAVQILSRYGAAGAFEKWLIFAAPGAGISPDGGTF